jgi:hypothetical protein
MGVLQVQVRAYTANGDARKNQGVSQEIPGIWCDGVLEWTWKTRAFFPHVIFAARALFRKTVVRCIAGAAGGFLNFPGDFRRL